MKNTLILLTWWFIIGSSNPIEVGHWLSKANCDEARRIVNENYRVSKCFQKDS